ncbi:phospholipase A and acyltransferase 3-like [Hemicordylus capensis]|uniref:phospholipase A and acyltransferase 3-like n=1 Tax=Hemicordylus capensis TaxID=884348 RepID=UPI0023046E60|nr:phospholipase A and acyltransferase 3-like [Hemicordylus capensis]
MSEGNYIEPKPGDLIEISRLGYQHWAIYVGSGYVIHMAPSDDLGQASASSLMSVVSEKAVVKKELLWSITGDDVCRVNNKYDRKYRPLPASQIVQEAESLLGKELRYSVASENCEHFVTRLRYGTARSDQVRDTLVAGTVGLVGVGVVAALATVISSLLLPSKREEK